MGQVPDWLGAGESGGKTVGRILGKCYPTQEGPGCGVPVESGLHPVAGPGGGDLEIRMKDCDAEGIDVQVLFGGMCIGLTSFDDIAFATDFARAYNDWLIGDICGRYPDRLKAVGIVALQDVHGAVAEVERAKALGAIALTIPPVLGDKNLDDPSLLPFFEAAAAADLAVGVHSSAPGMNVPLPAADRFDNYAQVHCLSFPVDQMVAFTALAMGGVLDRFPTLRVAFLESGTGWVPYFVHRMHEHFEKRGPCPRDEERAEGVLDRAVVFVSFECEDPFVETYIERMDPTALVFASDYPHWDCEFPGAVEMARRRSAHLGDDVVDRILGGNAQRLYRLT